MIDIKKLQSTQKRLNPLLHTITIGDTMKDWAISHPMMSTPADILK